MIFAGEQPRFQPVSWTSLDKPVSSYVQPTITQFMSNWRKLSQLSAELWKFELRYLWAEISPPQSCEDNYASDLICRLLPLSFWCVYWCGLVGGHLCRLIQLKELKIRWHLSHLKSCGPHLRECRSLCLLFPKYNPQSGHFFSCFFTQDFLCSCIWCRALLLHIVGNICPQISQAGSGLWCTLLWFFNPVMLENFRPQVVHKGCPPSSGIPVIA